jgi:hypothetical protein
MKLALCIAALASVAMAISNAENNRMSIVVDGKT